ncbi:hypothetical protein TcWFU_006631 [Taenia crassiceps]|uniref:Uncharacterized protein n=1 Tax=Taenia crassiceps TaxID=6207 RepID=A0ABR4Q0U7_9CEST
MDSTCDVVEVPIEAAQEYIATAIGFAPLHLSDLIFNIGDDVVLPDDIPQTTYSRKKHDWIKKSIAKYERNLMLLNLAKKGINEELANLKVLHEDLRKASTMIGDAIQSDFGGASVEEFRLSVDALIHGRESVANFLKHSNSLS